MDSFSDNEFLEEEETFSFEEEDVSQGGEAPSPGDEYGFPTKRGLPSWARMALLIGAGMVGVALISLLAIGAYRVFTRAPGEPILPPLLSPNTPEKVTQRFYEATQGNDQDTMLDCIEPSLREGFLPFDQVLTGLDWWLLAKNFLKLEGRFVRLYKLDYVTLQKDESTAQVRVIGRVEIIPLKTVREFNITHTLVKVDGNWYLSSPR